MSQKIVTISMQNSEGNGFGDPWQILSSTFLKSSVFCYVELTWIKLISGYYGSGNTQLMYLVRPNSAAASRTGTISVGGRTLTLTQNAATTTAELNPLSYKVAAADYSKSLDRLVLASASSNELH